LGIANWFRKQRRSFESLRGDKPTGDVAVDERTVPEEVRKYLATVEQHKQHPFVRQYYRQVAVFGCMDYERLCMVHTDSQTVRLES
jgi:hypothetical protein